MSVHLKFYKLFSCHFRWKMTASSPKIGWFIYFSQKFSVLWGTEISGPHSTEKFLWKVDESTSRFLSSLKVTIFPHRVTWFEAVCHLILTDVFPTRIHLKTFSHCSILFWIEWKRRMWMSSNIIGLQVKIICILLIRDMVVKCWNRQFGCETIHPTQKFILMNLLQMFCMIIWSW